MESGSSLKFAAVAMQMISKAVPAAFRCLMFLAIVSVSSGWAADDPQGFEETSILQAPGINDSVVSDSSRQILREVAAHRRAAEYDTAITKLRTAFVQVRQETEGQEHPLVVEILDEAVDVFIQAGRYEQAEGPLDNVITLREQQVAASEDRADRAYQQACLAGANLKLGWVLSRLGDPNAALPPFSKAVAGFETIFGISHQVVRRARQLEVSALWDAARLREAIAAQTKLVESLKRNTADKETLQESIEAKALLSMLLIRAGEFGAARMVWDAADAPAGRMAADDVLTDCYRGLVAAISGDYLATAGPWRRAKSEAIRQNKPGTAVVCDVLLATEKELWDPQAGSAGSFERALAAVVEHTGAITGREIELLEIIVEVLLDRSVLDRRLAGQAAELAEVIKTLKSKRGNQSPQDRMEDRIRLAESRFVAGDDAATDEIGPDLLEFRTKFGRGHRVTITGFVLLLRAAVLNDDGALAKAVGDYLCDVNPEEGAIASEASLSLLIGRASGMNMTDESPIAETLYTRWKKAREIKQSDQETDLSDTLLGLATGLQAEAKSEQAISLYQAALQMREKQYGKDTPEVAAVLVPLAYAYWLSGDAVSSRQTAQRAEKIWVTALGNKHPLVQLCTKLTQ